MSAQDAFWSAQEVRTQAEQCHDQLTVWDVLEDVAPDDGADDA